MARRFLAACIFADLCRVWAQNGPGFSGVWHYVDVHSIMCPGGKGPLVAWEQLRESCVCVCFFSPNRNCWGSQFILQRVDGQDDLGT